MWHRGLSRALLLGATMLFVPAAALAAPTNPTVQQVTPLHAPVVLTPAAHAPVTHTPAQTVHAPVVLAPTVHAPIVHAPTTSGPHPASEIPVPPYPGAFKAAVATLFGPLAGVAENRFGFRYPVKPYIKEVEAGAGGRGAVVRSSRPSSLATNVTPELTAEHVLVLARHTNPASLHEGYAFLRAKGIDVVVDLRFEGKESEARAAAEAAGVEYHNVKLKDNAWFNPQPVLVAAVNAIEKAARGGKTVDVHCEAGIGRTGLVIAAYKALRNGMNPNEAVAYARDNGLQLFGQEHALKVFVRSFADGAITRAPDGSLALAGSPE